MRKNFFIAILGLLLATGVHAQDDAVPQAFQQAEQEFQIGRVAQSRELLLSNMSQFQGTVRQEAYRLLTLCYLSEDNDEEARHCAQLLLDESPYYTPSLQDPQLFVDLIATLRAGRSASITTASRQAETLEEAPVPVTLITEEMIRLSTARNLQELLDEYVPGMGVQEGEQANLVVRGVLDHASDNILVMRNGVRMNSFLTLTAPLDYRVSLANVKQIEVLRGPASSLYGNAALMAVVNIITKDGADVDGIKVTAGGGNFHTWKGDFVAGKQFLDSNVLVWASIYNSKGTRWDIPADSQMDNYGADQRDGYLYVGGYNRRPSYDIGLNYSWKGLTIYATHQYGKRVLPYTASVGLYPYDDMFELEGDMPGYASSVSTANLRYANTWKRWSLEANVMGTYETLKSFYPRALVNEVYQTKSPSFSWGGDVKAVYKYPASCMGEGSLLVGMQMENYKWVEDEYRAFFISDLEEDAVREQVDEGYINMQAVTSVYNYLERTISPFLQMKHSFSPGLIANLGLRYDIRDRAIGKNISKLSPRLALIYMPSPRTSVKFSYGHSFVDMTVGDRLLQKALDSMLEPHSVDNIQLSGMFSFPKLNLQWETNLFYNKSGRVRFLAWDLNNTFVKNVGWENVLTYSQPGFQARFTTYLQHIISNSFVEREDVPEFHHSWQKPPSLTCSDLMMHLKLSKRLLGSLWLTANGSFASAAELRAIKSDITNPNDPVWESTDSRGLYSFNTPARFLLDLGARYSWRCLDFSVICKNALNHTYRLIGERDIVLQQRRTLLATLTVSL